MVLVIPFSTLVMDETKCFPVGAITLAGFFTVSSDQIGTTSSVSKTGVLNSF